MRKKPAFQTGLRWLLYLLMLFFAAAVQTQGWLAIGQVRPILLIPVCLAVTVYEGEFAGALFGAVGGLLWEALSGRVAGILAVQLLIICFFVSLLCRLYLRNTVFNFICLTGLSCLLVLTVDFLLFYYLDGYHSPFVYYTTVLLPACIYTGILSFPFRFLAQRIHRLEWGKKKQTKKDKLS